MKTCSYCWEGIQDQAKKCRYCWERLNPNQWKPIEAQTSVDNEVLKHIEEINNILDKTKKKDVKKDFESIANDLKLIDEKYKNLIKNSHKDDKRFVIVKDSIATQLRKMGTELFNKYADTKNSIYFLSLAYKVVDSTKLKQKIKEDIEYFNEEIKNMAWCIHIKDIKTIEEKMDTADILDQISAFFLNYIRFQKPKRISRRTFWLMSATFLGLSLLVRAMTSSDSGFLNILSFIMYIGLLILLIEKIIKRYQDIWMWMGIVHAIIVISIVIWFTWEINEPQIIALFRKGIILTIMLYIILILFFKKSENWDNKWWSKPKV